MTSLEVVGARRNAAVVAATAVTVGVLFLFPSSTNSTTRRGPARLAAPAGVVSAAPAPADAGAPTRGPVRAAAGPAAPVRRATAAGATTVVNGTSTDTQYGPVQVQLKVRGGRIVSATAIDFPQGGQTEQQINSHAIPVLQQETLAAQSAHIDAVSGATYTSGGYVTSLQAALDAAHLR